MNVPDFHEHIWAVRSRKEPYTYLDGDTLEGYSVYFCTKCLLEKTVSDSPNTER